MKVDTSRRRKNAPRAAEKSAPGFLAWLRQRNCACAGRNVDCDGKIQAAHVPDPAFKGIGTKSRDSYAIPLSVWCHSLQHSLGWPAFAEMMLGGADPRQMAEAYWHAWPSRRAWEIKHG